MAWIKQYWFAAIIGMLLLFFGLLVVAILVAPKYDARNRGFGQCTQALMGELADCNTKIGCTVAAIAKNTLCDIKVMTDGFKLWFEGSQKYPWSNYVFEPETIPQIFVDQEAREEYLRDFPDVKEEMKRLNELRKELEHEQDAEEFTPEMLPQ